MKTRVEMDKPVPDFHVQATSRKDVKPEACRGYNMVLYFYPKDDTPGCTLEGKDFRDLYQAFKEARTCIFGVSRDSLESHERFKQKHGFPFELISDPEETLCDLFDVIQLKNMYGRELLGVERSTFLINANGVLRKEWRKVKVENHAQEVLEAARSLT